jgi:homocysteine S-methyltransferase
VDLLAIETMPQLAEIEAVLQLLHDEYPNVICWISCTLKDSKHLSDGTAIEDLIRLVERHQDQVVAVGINCVPTEVVTDALNTLKSYTELPLLCYPNSGEVWDAVTKTWSGQSPTGEGIKQQIQGWRDGGARLIGGCCRTGPKYIEVIKNALDGK